MAALLSVSGLRIGGFIESYPKRKKSGNGEDDR
jgi:hypothetical protein